MSSFFSLQQGNKKRIFKDIYYFKELFIIFALLNCNI